MKNQRPARASPGGRTRSGVGEADARRRAKNGNLKKMKEKNIIYDNSSVLLPASKLPQPSAKKKDFRQTAQWRIFRIMAEFIEGFQFLVDFKKTVTFFGSARFPENNPDYKRAQKLAYLLGKAGFTIITGGGPGIMEAANKGAHEAKTHSVGLNIQLPYEQRINKYIKKGIGFHYFFTRKVILSYSAQAYVYFPGGFGTLDEFFEIITLIQTKKITQRIPVICVGKKYWTPILKWINTDVYGKFKAIDKEDEKIYTMVDSPEEAFKIIKASKKRTPWI